MKTKNFNSVIGGKVIIMILVLIFSFSDLYAQKKYLPENKKYPSAKIYYDNNKVIGVKNIVLINDSTLNFNYAGSMNKEMVSTQNVKFVTVKKGSNALAFSLVGAGIGVLSVALTQGKSSSDPLLDDVNWGPIYLGFAAGGFLIGAIIGEMNRSEVRVSWFSLGYAAVRLILIPGISFVVLRLCNIDTVITAVSVLLAGMPVGSTTASVNGRASVAKTC
ncbi:MAG: hypothetical protein EOM06_09690 [Sphingobacteriia bacterium]|nr:hypothetical protein [Sphingobacteriia bacterium]